MANLIYHIGDATQPIGTGVKVIGHVCNDKGAWGAGFVCALSRRWQAPERSYRCLWLDKAVRLGDSQLVRVEEDTFVANLVAQRGVGRDPVSGEPPIRYLHLVFALRNLLTQMPVLPWTFHCPRLGCGLAGGKWTSVAWILRQELVDKGVDVVVYDLPNDE